MMAAIDYALMAGAAYRSNRDLKNRFPVPQGWSEIAGSYRNLSNSSGFEAVSFTKGTEIVISYAGTDFSAPGTDFTQANIPLTSGYSSAQLEQAADYYLQVKALNSSAHITFTGHSLGGGLAALMGVFFDETAVTFDQAPFRASATEYLDTDADGNTITRAAAETLRTYLANHTPPADLAKLDAYIAANHIFNPSGIAADTLTGREANVTNTNVLGEVLSLAPVSAFDRIGINADANNLAQQNNMLVARLDLHSQALLTALLQSGDTSASTSADHTLGQATFKLPDLLKMIFDKNLFASDPLNKDAPVENFLERLVKHEAGIGATISSAAIAADAMVTRFTEDLWKLAEDGGLTLTDGSTGDPALNEVSKALTAFAMQFYYENTPNAINAGKELFTAISGGIQFDMTDVSASLGSAKGYTRYFSNYLKEAAFSIEAQAAIATLLPKLRDWTIQAGAGSLTATDIQNRGAFLLGGSGSDTLTGGDKADLLVGNGGTDTLKGGKGNDTLIGGAGNDTYTLDAGDGFDTVLDSDGSGLINIAGIQALGSTSLDPTKWKQFGSDAWVDTLNGITYSRSVVNGETQLLIHKGDSNIVVKGWAAGELGIVLGAGSISSTTAPPAPDLTIVGDLKPISGDLAGVDALDNVKVSGVTDPDREDVLYDSFGNDRILGLGGNDTLYAWRGGDDLIDGGTGSDYVSGGAGNDTLIGGTDSDVLLGGAHNDQLFATEIVADLAAAILAGEVQPGTGSRGDWLSGDDGTDTLVGDAGNDILLGGENEDLLLGGGGNDNIWGDRRGSASIDWTATRSVQQGPGGSIIYATDTTNGYRVDAALGAADVIYGGAGDDWIQADQGNDIIDAGADNDVVFGGQGADMILGQGGNDVLMGNAGVNDPLNDGADYIDGGIGNDQLWGAGGSDYLLGGADNDELNGDGNGTSSTDEGEDVLDGGAGDDKLWGGGKNDTLMGGADNDFLYGEAGDDLLDGGTGIDHLVGGADNDTYLNVSSDDTIFDIEGNNTIVLAAVNGLGAEGLTAIEKTGSDGNTFIQLGVTLDDGSVLKLDSPFFASDSNTLQFANGEVLDVETLVSEQLTTQVSLRLGDSGGRLFGGAGDDFLGGGAGNDTLIGYKGNDILQGGGGDDTYLGVTGGDTLFDIQGNNTVVLAAARLGAGGLSASVQTNADGVTYMQLSVALDTGGVLKLDSPFFADGTTTLQFEGESIVDLETLVSESLTTPLNLQLGDAGGRVYGAAEADTLKGGAGADTLIGDDIIDSDADDEWRLAA